MRTLEQLHFDNTFKRLGGEFFTPLQPTAFKNCWLVHFNSSAAELIDLNPSEAQRPDFAAIISGKAPWSGTEPIAMVYSGHQFGVYNPSLGDGRGLLLGEVRNERGEKWDLHLKGAGKTPYSRFGDGRAVLRSSIREYLGSEAMAGLGISTSRALCLIGSDEVVMRETAETGAMLLRLAQSHVRFGHFEYFFYEKRYDLLKTLLDYCIEQHHPELKGTKNAYIEFFQRVTASTAELMAQWQAIGFAHGVMNTDNFSIHGITFDYGPFGFLDRYDPGHICNHSDETGRYAFNRQPGIGLWNLNALAHALTPLIPQEALIEALKQYEPRFVAHWEKLMRQKLGLATTSNQDIELIIDLLELLAQNHLDYTRFFRDLSDYRFDTPNTALRDQFLDRAAWDHWVTRYENRLKAENSEYRERRQQMHRRNPKFVLRNYLAKIAIDKARQGDYQEIDTLMKLLSQPFDEHPEYEAYAALPPDWGHQLEISCSS